MDAVNATGQYPRELRRLMMLEVTNPISPPNPLVASLFRNKIAVWYLLLLLSGVQ